MLYKVICAIVYPIIWLLFRPEVDGLNNFPAQGKTIVYSNHIFILDPLVIGCILPRKVFFMAKSELFKNPVLAWILKHVGAFPVKRGTADISAIKNSLKVLNAGGVFGIFPEGTRSMDGNLQLFSHGIASIAHKSKATIIPIAIMNEYKLFKPLRIKIGRPLNFENYFEQKSNTELLEKMSAEMGQAIKRMLD